MKQQCDNCETTNKDLCAECQERAQANADRYYDELREEGYTSAYQKHLADEAEDRAMHSLDY